MTLSLALNYGSRWEISQCVSELFKELSEDKTKIVKPEFVENYIDEHITPNVELMIRTSGEQRLSNFLLWQLAYAELYFTDKLWPDFRKEDLHEAIVNFQNRERRYGKTSEQLV